MVEEHRPVPPIPVSPSNNGPNQDTINLENLEQRVYHDSISSEISNKIDSSKPLEYSNTEESRFNAENLGSLNYVSNIKDHISYFKWMDCIRQDDLNTADELIKKFWFGDRSNSSDRSSSHPSVTSALILCASFGQPKMMDLLLSHLPDPSDINSQDSSGNTCLHYASKSGRTSIVDLLLKNPHIDDTIQNDAGKEGKDLARNGNVLEVIEANRRKFIQAKHLELIQLCRSQNLSKLEQFFNSHRVKNLISINYQEPLNGETPLHISCAFNNVNLVDWCVRMDADPSIRDKEGKLAIDKTKNDRIRQTLKDVLSRSNTHLLSPTDNSNRMQGKLHKWTNYAGGYKNRWFILEEGVLSYYKSQEDVPVSCRGSISLQIAKLWIDTSDRNRFDIVSRSGERWHLKADHAMEAKRWVVAITEAKQWLQDQDEFYKRQQQQNQISINKTNTMAPRMKSNYAPPSAGEVESISGSALNQSIFGNSEAGTPQSRRKFETPYSPSHKSAYMDSTSDDHEAEDEEMGDGYLETREKEIEADKNYEENIHALINSCLASVQYQGSLVSSIIGKSNGDSSSQNSELDQLLKNFRETGISLENTINLLLKKFFDREKQWQRRYEREEDLKQIWEDNLRSLAKEHYELQTSADHQVSVLRSQAKAAASALSLGASNLIDDSGQDGVDLLSEDEDEFFDAVDEYTTTISSGTPIVSTDDGINDTSLPEVLRNAVPGYHPNPPMDLRKQLPSLGSKPPEISLWSILRNNIGKDLSKIALPVFFNEPLSMLQRLCEDMEYSTLLDIAASRVGGQYDSGRFERLLFVGAFAMSNYSSTQGRTGKPFNPLLGETFEYVRKDRGFRYLSEQVSHHPPVSACHCESENYVFWAEVNLKNRFWGKSLEITPQGVCHAILKSTNEHFSWRKVTTSVNGLIVGKLYIDHYGDMIVTNHSTGDECLIRFKQTGWRGKNQFEIEGNLTTKNGTKLYHLFGRWDERLMCRPEIDESEIMKILKSSPSYQTSSTRAIGLRKNSMGQSFENIGEHKNNLLWKRNPCGPQASKQYNLTDFALSLNENPSDLGKQLPLTDCRLRPDQKAMENGDYDLADKEKIRLEDAQRKRRYRRQENGQSWSPNWFKKEIDPDTGDGHWVYKGGYWESREKGNWPESVINIFE